LLDVPSTWVSGTVKLRHAAREEREDGGDDERGDGPPRLRNDDAADDDAVGNPNRTPPRMRPMFAPRTRRR